MHTLKRSFRFLCIQVLLLAFWSTTYAQEQPGYVAGQVIVKKKSGQSASALQSARAELGAVVMRKFELIDAELWQLASVAVEDAVAQYRGDVRFEYIEPNYRYKLIESATTTPDDPEFNRLWGLHNTGQTGGLEDADIDAPEAWDIETGRDVIVGVIDSGVQWSHPDLAANIWTNPGEIPNNGIDDDGNGYIDDVRGWDFVNNDNNPDDDAGHGTHVAGTIAAVGDNGVGITGVSWQAKIMALKFLAFDGLGTTADAISAIEYAVMMGARLTNNSWGGGEFSTALYDAIEAAGEAGQLFMAAASNDALDNDLNPHYPSNFDLDNIIAVAATNHNDDLASFSNYGATSVDLGAPGESIYSTYPSNRYVNLSGTSMATPHVSGVASLVWSRVPGLSGAQVRNILLESVDPVSSLSNRTVTGGRLNAFNALVLAEPDSIPPAAITDLAVAETRSNSVLLSWTATGDDSLSGTAAAYDIRFDTEPIEPATVDLASRAIVPIKPQPAGEPETYLVTGLAFNTEYYFAIRVIDEQDNSSALSNVVSTTTLGVPNIVVSPDSIGDDLLTGESSSHLLTITNDADGTLDFNINITGINEANAVLSAPSRTGNAGIKSTAAAEDRYAAHPIKNGAAELPVISPAKLAFYDRIVAALADSFVVFHDDMESGDNGWTHYSTYLDGLDLWNTTQDRARSGNTSWRAMQHDFEGSDALQLPAIDLAGLESAMLSFWHWYDFDDCDDITFTPDGGIVEISADGGASWTQIRPVDGYPFRLEATCANPLDPSDAYAHAGGNGEQFIPAFFDLSAFVGNEVILRFHAGWDCGNCDFNDGWFIDDVTVYSESFIGWASVTPESGVIPAGESLEITVNFDATSLDGGAYDARLVVANNDPDDSLHVVPLHIDVTGAPDMAVSPASLDFDSVFVAFTATRTLTITNIGADILAVADISSDDMHFTVTPDSFELAPRTKQDVVVSFIPDSPQLYEATLTIMSNDATDPTTAVALRGQGTIPPVIEVTPTAISDTLLTGQQSNQILTIANTAADGVDLQFEIKIEKEVNAAQRKPAVAAAPFEPVKGERDPRKGEPVTHGFGGPDAFGYSWIDSDEPGGPAFQWQDITAVGTELILSDDSAQEVELPFSFDFYGQSKNRIVISSNGFLTFSLQGAASSGNQPIPQTAVPNDVIAPFWTDLNPSFGGDIHYYYDDGLNRFIVQYTNVPHFSFAGAATFQIILDADGGMLFQYLRMTTALEAATVGIEDSTGQDGLQVAFNTPYVHDSLAVAIDTQPVFVSVSPTSGRIPGGETRDVTVSLDATGLIGDDYRATLIILSNDPDDSEVPTPVHLRVIGAPDITLSTTTIDYDSVFLSVTKVDTLTVVNAGTDVLNVTQIASDNPVFTADVENFVLGAGQRRHVRVSFAPVAAGPANGTLTIVSDDPDESQLTVSLAGIGVPPPDISVAPANFSFFLTRGDSTTASLNLSNSGNYPLRFALHFEETFEGLAHEATSGGKRLYWDIVNFINDSLFSSNLDGSDPQLLLTRVGLGGIAVDAANERLYYANFDDGSIYTAGLDGSNDHVLIRGVFGPNDVVLDPIAGKIYWTEFSGGRIGRANLDGSEREIVVQGAGTAPTSADAPGPHDARSDHPGPVKTAAEPEVLLAPWGMDLDLLHQKIYWTEQSGHTVKRANLDGSDIEVLDVGSLNAPRGIKVDAAGGRIYFVDSFNGMLKSANLDGSGVTVLVENAENPLDIELDLAAGELYWTDNILDLIQKMKFDGTDRQTIVERFLQDTRGPFGLGLMSGPSWLTLTPDRGSIQAGREQIIEVAVNAKELELGNYSGKIIVDSNDPDEPVIEIDVQLRVDSADVVIAMPDTVVGQAGEVVSVPVLLTRTDAGNPIGALGAAVHAPGNLLSFVGFTPGEIAAGGLEVSNPAPDTLLIGFVDFGGGPITEDGVLVTLNYEIAAGAEDREIAALTLSQLSATGTDGSPRVTIGRPGQVTVVNFINLSGSVRYSSLDESSPPRLVHNFPLQLRQDGIALQDTVTDTGGNFEIGDVPPTTGYSLHALNLTGGVGTAITPGDAFLAFNEFLGNFSLRGAQKLAADVDGDLEITADDAFTIFDRFLRRVTSFPETDWRAYPVTFDIDASEIAWRAAPDSVVYPNLNRDQLHQDFFAVARGDVDLSWQPVSTPALLAKPEGEPAAKPVSDQLRVSVQGSEFAPFSDRTTFRISLDRAAQTGGLFALGVDVRYDATALEITDVRWGNGFSERLARAGHYDLRDNEGGSAAKEQKTEDHLTGRLRLGVLATSAEGLAGAALVDVEVRLRSESAAAGKLPLRLENISAVVNTASPPVGKSAATALNSDRFSFEEISVEDSEGALLLAAQPEAFALEANYPNPFNPKTRIRYALPEAAQVRLEVFNALGQRIRSLVSAESQDVGFYEVEWLGDNDAGVSVASGVYFYRLVATGTTERHAEIRKMLLLK